MTDNSFTINTNESEYNISACVRLIGEDVLVSIWGGEKPHIGAVAMAQPRKSLKDDSLTSSTASVFTYVGHKEDELAKAVSEIMAAVLKTKVVVTAGIHWDNLSSGGIQKVIQNSKILVDLILERLTSII
ncbi:MAG: hypothetical protein ABFS43_01040 [Thermodesulfobacteriota bacterium]